MDQKSPANKVLGMDIDIMLTLFCEDPVPRNQKHYIGSIKNSLKFRKDKNGGPFIDLEDILRYCAKYQDKLNLGPKTLAFLEDKLKRISEEYFGNPRILYWGMKTEDLDNLSKINHAYKPGASPLNTRDISDIKDINVFFTISLAGISQTSGKKIYFIDITHIDENKNLTKLNPINAGTSIDRAENRLAGIKKIFAAPEIDYPINLEKCEYLAKRSKYIRHAEFMEKY